MIEDDWKSRAVRMGRTTARLREGHIPEIQIWSTRRVPPTRDPCITCGDALDMASEAMEVFSVEGVRLLFHPECHDMWIALRERAHRTP